MDDKFKSESTTPQNQFWPLSMGKPHSLDVNHCVLHIQSEGHREPHNMVRSISMAERLVVLNWEPSDSHYNALTN